MPQQNRIAERANSILMEKARSMMQCVEDPDRIWADAVATATHVRNLTPSSVLNWHTSREEWYSKKPNVNHSKVFGCKVEVLVPSARHTKLNARSKEVPIFEISAPGETGASMISRQGILRLMDPLNFTSWKKYRNCIINTFMEPVNSMHCCMRKINIVRT